MGQPVFRKRRKLTGAMDAELIGRAAELGRTALRENAAETDAVDIFPARSVQAVREAGLLPLTVPRRYGGLEASLPTACRVIEELAVGCTATALILSMHWISLYYLGDWCLALAQPDEARALEELRERVFADVVADGALLASCYGEPGSGSNIFLPFTQAEPVADGWRITGRKFGTLAEAASYLALHAVVTTGPQARSVVQFIVPADTPGITIRRLSGLVGVRGPAPCAVEFESCLIGERYRFLPPGWFGPTNEAYPYATLLVMSPYAGAARAAIEAATEFSRLRNAPGFSRPAGGAARGPGGHRAADSRLRDGPVAALPGGRVGRALPRRRRPGAQRSGQGRGHRHGHPGVHRRAADVRSPQPDAPVTA